MFSNFVTFKEVVKLSENIFYGLRTTNYHDKLLELIYNQEDVIAFEEVIDLVDNKYLVTRFLHIFEAYWRNDRERWLKNILKVIDHIDVSYLKNTLLVQCSRYKYYNFVERLVEKGIDLRIRGGNALLWAGYNGNLEIIKFLTIKGADLYAFEYIPKSILLNHPGIIEYLLENGVNLRE